ncbi:hypothetical protein BO82DRAFT_403224 [Aspergillus uvarum CBS 121591]|uniref:Uncharacterized protein n=1 Tax=Aspergillus uvarum CBS 121591 TaxID=1448315 RepID=A0A319CPJ8_9EURO|nr:hypothetical protein BO82DRAFT_403224 [Aspergillus uvarum CBS 121591]PYH80673.1 hypothetical protein BO82DRAFT_403224 [Aspergillus uvarum CBS 121591]
MVWVNSFRQIRRVPGLLLLSLTAEACRSPAPSLHPPLHPPLREALIECFRATTRLVRPELRRQLILVDGAASIAHSSVLFTEDVDVAAPPDVLTGIGERVTAGALNFSLDPDGKISFDASQGFQVRIDLIEHGKDIIERIHVAEPFYEGSAASMSDLLVFRAVTVVDRGVMVKLLTFDGCCRRWQE